MCINDEDDEYMTEVLIGNDDLLADEYVRLPAGSNILTRLRALQIWLVRRRDEAELAVGMAVHALQMEAQEAESESRPRRRLSQVDLPASPRLSIMQQRLSAYEEAQTLLDSCITHTTVGERLLVEYYLSLEEMIQETASSADSPWLSVMSDVLHRVSQVGTPVEEEE